MLALNLNPALLDLPRLAFDQALGDEPDPGDLRVKLEKILCAALSGRELEKARSLLEHHLGGGEYDGAASDEDDEDEPVDEEELRVKRRKTMARVADWLAKEKSLNDEEIFDSMKDFPAPGLERLGGRLAEDLEQLMRDRSSRMAKDQRRKRQAFDQRYPVAGRVTAGVESDYGTPIPARRIAIDGAAERSFAERFPGAARIGGPV